MNKRKSIYRGFNKRRKNNEIKAMIVVVAICIAGGYGYTKIKNSDTLNGFKESISLDKFTGLLDGNDDMSTFEYDDVSKELEKQDENKEEATKDDTANENTEEVKRADIKEWKFYAIQVASITNSKELGDLEVELEQKEIPFSIVDVNGVKKVQTYASFEQDTTRAYLEDIRKYYPDAFFTQVDMPMLSLEYTEKYDYISGITDSLNDLIDNFEEESAFWSNKKEDFSEQEYNKILTDRQSVIEVIKKECDKIDYDGANVFKDKLVVYINTIEENIEISSKSAYEQKYNISQGLYIDSMQGYLEFIGSIQ